MFNYEIIYIHEDNVLFSVKFPSFDFSKIMKKYVINKD